jgi:uncharacterized protein with HEPN domain
MPRDYRLYLDDMHQALTRILRYIGTHDYTTFASDDQLVDAVVRNLDILGEAAKHLPDSIRQNHAAIPWNQIAGLRDILTHQYFGVSLPIVWDVVQNEVPALLASVRAMLQEEDRDNK